MPVGWLGVQRGTYLCAHHWDAEQCGCSQEREVGKGKGHSVEMNENDKVMIAAEVKQGPRGRRGRARNVKERKEEREMGRAS